MSDNILSKGNNLKCRRRSQSVKKSLEPNDLAQIFSIINLASEYESRPPRRPKIPVNYADFSGKNSEIHQMVEETSELNKSSNNVKKQKKKKNISSVQTQVANSVECQKHISVKNQKINSVKINEKVVSVQTHQIAKSHVDFVQKKSVIHHMVAETSDLKKSSKNVKTQEKKKLSSEFESRPPRRSKLPVNYADFVEKNSEIYQMVVETSDLKKFPNNVKKQRKRKNISSVQSQDALSVQCQKHIPIGNRKTISIQSDEVSIQSQQIISLQTDEVNLLETPELVSVESVLAEFNGNNVISSQEESILEVKKKRSRRSKRKKVLANILCEESSSIQVEDAENSTIEAAPLTKHCNRTFTSSKLCKTSKLDAKPNSKTKPKSGNEESSSPENDENDSEKEKFPPYINKQDVLKLMENQPKDNPGFVEGHLRINVKYYKHAYVPVPGNEMDILIIGIRDRNRALEGDLVIVCINAEDKWYTHSTDEVQKTGVIVCIVEKNHPRKAVGFIKKTQNGINFQPRDSRIPFLKIINPQMLSGAFHENPKSFENTLFLAKISSWVKPGFAFGKLKQSVGKTGDLIVETNAILLENDLNVNPFEDALLRELPSSGYIPTVEDLEGREDWRSHCIFTIDPATAQDLDDAVSCQHLVNGNYEVGVHISDVTHFLKAFTPLDERVAGRGTTVYLVDNVYHMLPKQLCDVCSLKPGQDKLTFSIIWEMTPSAEVVRQRFAKTVINSCCQISYEQAQAMIENPLNDWSKDSSLVVKGEHDALQLCEIINNLYKLSLQMRERRFADGALRIDQPKLYISLDRETGLPVSCSIEENKDSNRLIEEFMLLANMSVAKQIYETMPETALLRSHKEPSNRILTQTRDMLVKFGVILNIESSGALQMSLKQYESESTENFAAKCRMMVINSLCAKSMTRAVYRCSNSAKNEDDLRHYALSVPLYTHFTSPIRRYPDCIVHRLLHASIKNVSLPSNWNSLLCTKLSRNCNAKKYSAKVAQEQSNELFFTYLLELNGPTNTQAVVMDVKDRSIDVIIIDVGFKTRIYLADVEEEVIAEFSVEHSAPTMKLNWKKTGLQQVINVFSIIDVLIQKHPSLFRLQGILLPPSSKIMNGLSRRQRKKQNKKKNGPSMNIESQN